MAEVLSLHGDLYSALGIQAAAEAWGGLARVVVVSEGDRFLVELAGLDPAQGTDAADAFANHALALTIRRRRAHDDPGEHGAQPDRRGTEEPLPCAAPVLRDAGPRLG